MMDKCKTPPHKARLRHDLQSCRGVLDLSIIQGAFPVAPCQTLVSRFATVSSLYVGRWCRWRGRPAGVEEPAGQGGGQGAQDARGAQGVQRPAWRRQRECGGRQDEARRVQDRQRRGRAPPSRRREEGGRHSARVMYYCPPSGPRWNGVARTRAHTEGGWQRYPRTPCGGGAPASLCLRCMGQAHPY
jgi:hypothetical protein